MPPVTLGKGVNPHGVLEAIIKQGAHVHGEENRVQHHAAAGPGGLNRLNQESQTLCKMTHPSHRFRDVEPKVLHIGDLVQVELLFIAVHLKEGSGS